MDYWVAGLVPSEEDMKAVERGQAGTPIGTPRHVTDLATP
jgi:penicillin-binding protein 2